MTTTDQPPSQTPELMTPDAQVSYGFRTQQLWEGESQAIQIVEDGKGGYIIHQFFGRRGHRQHRAIILSADDLDFMNKQVKKMEKARVAAVRLNLLDPHYGPPVHSCERDLGLRFGPDEELPQVGDTVPMITSVAGRSCVIRIDKIVEHRLHDDGHHLLTVHGIKTYTDEED